VLAFDPTQWPYHVDVVELGPALGPRFRALAPDRGVFEFVQQVGARPHGFLRLQLANLLSPFFNAYDLHGKLGLYNMHLLSAEQWNDLLGSTRRGSLLDVGAGAGYVTEHARALFSRIVCTDTSGPLCNRLRARGFEAHERDLGLEPLGERFEVVSCFNVLDRTAYPLRLLRALLTHLAPDGRILLSVPLPLRPHVHVKGGTVAQDERLPVGAERFEHAARELSVRVLEQAGMTVERLARVPYLSRGDAHRPLYALDAAVFVCSAASAPTVRT